MTADALDLARRAVACPGWRWMPRMRATLGSVDAGDVAAIGALGVHVVWDWECGATFHDPLDLLPDLTDPATLGCLLALVREAWGVASVVYLPRDGAVREWRVVTYAHGADWLTPARLLGEGPTEAAALVAALEAAP